MACEVGDGGRPCSGEGVWLVRVGDLAQVRWVWLVIVVMVGDPALVRLVLMNVY